MKLIECVPNFSEGRNQQVVDAIAQSFDTVKGVHLLDKEMDFSHHRSVITAIGEPDALLEASFASIKKAVALIDLNKHQGGHPRIGAADVIPFIPIRQASMEDCINLAKKLGERVGKELNLPVYLYGQAAIRPERRELPNVRKGQFEGLKQELGINPEKTPDFGPDKIHPTAGAVAIGARFFLIAYNVNLKSSNVELAKNIAKTIRESSGGFKCVKGMGLAIPEKNAVQVSMNLTDYRVTSISTVYTEIEKLAKEKDVEILESELIGLAPASALPTSTIDKIKLTNFSPSQIIENRLSNLGIL